MFTFMLIKKFLSIYLLITFYLKVPDGSPKTFSKPLWVFDPLGSDDRHIPNVKGWFFVAFMPTS